MSAERARIAVLLSGRGSNFLALRAAAERDSWRADFALVVSNEADAPGLAAARTGGLTTVVLDHRPYGGAGRSAYDAALVALLRAHRIDWVVLAGFMRILTPTMTEAYAGRILNIHPSLLPKYPGLHTHRRALEAGDREHGCSVHLVDATLDGGPLLAQARVPVLPDDTEETLAARVLRQEHLLYPQVVWAALTGTLPRPEATAVEESAP